MTQEVKALAVVRVRVVRLVIVALAGLLVGVGVFAIVRAVTQPRRTTQVYDPPVLAGQPVWGYCSGGFYARHGDTIVLTSTGHCTSEGTVAYGPDGVTVLGVFGPAARDASCPYPGHMCASSDLNYLVVAEGPESLGPPEPRGPGHRRLPHHPGGHPGARMRRHRDR